VCVYTQWLTTNTQKFRSPTSSTFACQIFRPQGRNVRKLNFKKTTPGRSYRSADSRSLHLDFFWGLLARVDSRIEFYFSPPLRKEKVKALLLPRYITTTLGSRREWNRVMGERESNRRHPIDVFLSSVFFLSLSFSLSRSDTRSTCLVAVCLFVHDRNGC
jgi:hypothetical protein